jgi:hypothetical protein
MLPLLPEQLLKVSNLQKPAWSKRAGTQRGSQIALFITPIHTVWMVLFSIYHITPQHKHGSGYKIVTRFLISTVIPMPKKDTEGGLMRNHKSFKFQT